MTPLQWREGEHRGQNTGCNTLPGEAGEDGSTWTECEPWLGWSAETDQEAAIKDCALPVMPDGEEDSLHW